MFNRSEHGCAQFPMSSLSGQRTVVHHLCIIVTALIFVEEAQVVDGV
jgi:hypothetical protein